MIGYSKVYRYCKEDISLIENYDKALADPEVMWECHHRDEVKVLPSGIVVRRTKAELLENGRYWHCPANELIFLHPSEHRSLHLTGSKRSSIVQYWIDYRNGLKKRNTCYTQSPEWVEKRRAAMLGKTHTVSEEARKRMSDAHKGKKLSLEHRKKLSEAAIAREARRRALKEAA